MNLADKQQLILFLIGCAIGIVALTIFFIILAVKNKENRK